MSDDRALSLSSACTSFLLIGFGLSAGYLEIESGYLDLVHRPHVSCNSCAGFSIGSLSAPRSVVGVISKFVLDGEADV